MVSGGQASPSWQPQQQDSQLEVLRGCTNFACLRAAHALPHSPGERFNFPHFFILGGEKGSRVRAVSSSCCSSKSLALCSLSGLQDSERVQPRRSQRKPMLN